MEFGTRSPSRPVRILRGLAVAVVLVVGGTAAVAGSAGMFTSLPVVTSTVQLSGSPLAVNAPVQYRGVVVGRLKAVEPVATGGTVSRIEMRIEPEQLARIPASVRVRILPRTVFGDQFLDLVDRAPRSGRFLSGGARIAPERSRETVDLYDTYEKLYGLITRLRPGQVNQVLTSMSTLLDGRGAEIGRLIDKADTVSAKLMPLTRQLGPAMRDIAMMSGKLHQAAPDLYATLGDAVRLSGFVSRRQDDIAAMLTGGARASDTVRRYLAKNQSNIITLLRTGNPVGSTFAAHPDGFGDLLGAFANLGNSVDGVSNKTTINLSTFDLYDAEPYTSRDCPRYPGIDGPNCALPPPPDKPLSTRGNPAPGPDPRNPAGTVGSSGSRQETDALRTLLPRITGSPDQPPRRSDGLLSLFLAPILRGTTVVTP